jgi:glycosyltransferase involved in cell wall biosynthesis
MKVIVTIPAFNEEENIASVIREIPRTIPGASRVQVLVLDDGSRDRTVDVALAAGADYVISNNRNRGLAYTFQRALNEALDRGADIIVNTDADNHYDQTRIPDLIAPILDHESDIVIGSRVLSSLKMRWANKQGNRVANYLMQRMLRIPDIDVSSGYRAYSREAALSLNILSGHTYTHETLFNALDRRLRIVSIPLEARHVERPSRLIQGLPKHVFRAGVGILQSMLRYRPLQAYGSLGLLFAVAGSVPFLRFLYFFAAGNGSGHLQSLVGGTVLLFLGVLFMIFGMLAKAISWNRQLLEEVLYRLKDDEKFVDSGLSSVVHLTEVKNEGLESNGISKPSRRAA